MIFDSRTAVDFDGEHGEVVGLGKGIIEIRDWNGGCIVGNPRLVRIPAKGDVVVDFGEPEGRPRRDRRPP